MSEWRATITAVISAAVVTSCGTPSDDVPTDHGADRITSGSAFTQSLPPLRGEHLTVSVVEVVYQGGGSSAPHTHPCPVIGRVVEGAVRMQVRGGAERTFAAGEAFYEAPNGVHLVSANASRAQPAKFLAFFVCDRSTPLTVGVPDKGAGDR